jgi:hypothetical protein
LAQTVQTLAFLVLHRFLPFGQRAAEVVESQEIMVVVVVLAVVVVDLVLLVD